MRNPFFSHAPKKIATWVAALIVFFVLVGLPAAFFYAPFMRFNAVDVEGLTTISEEDVIQIAQNVLQHHRWFVLPGSHLFFANRKKIVQELDATFLFDTLLLSRKGRTLLITAKERITDVALTTNGATYLVDLHGVAVSGASPEALAMFAARRHNATEIPFAPGLQPTMPLIDVTDPVDVSLGAVLIDAVRLQNILALDNALRDRSMTPLFYTLETAATPWLIVAIAGGPSLLVDISSSPENAMVMYDAFVKERSDLTALPYIDIRFGDHVYIKTK